MDSFVCPTCDMTFRSLHFLAKHKEKFCIGKVGHTEQRERIRGPRRRRQQQRAETLKQDQPNYQSIQPGLQKPTTEIRPSNIAECHFQDLSGVHECQLVLPNERKLHGVVNSADIAAQSNGLASQDENVAHLERMLLELRTLEQKNTSLLETLNSNKGQDILQSNNSQLHVPKSRERLSETYVPVNREGVLSTEISSLHLFYLQSGGKDPTILAELQDLLKEALNLEMQNGKRPQPKTHHKPMNKRNHCSKDLISTELENQQLEEEITRLQLRRKRSIISRPLPNRHLSEHEIKTVKLDIDKLKREIVINRLKRQIKGRKLEPSLVSFPPMEEPISQAPPLINSQTDASDFGSYDPEAGFVVFYDFLLGLCPLYRVCRLMVAVYSGDQPLGIPAVLNPVYCEPCSFSTVSPQYSLGHKAILAFKQAVPGVHPDESISLVMQLQASGGNDISGQEVTHLAPRGWVKLDLFDHNCVITGRWKIPVRILPVKPSMTAEINAVPQLDSAELYLRIVNQRDAETQSAIPISIHNAGIYRYPTVKTRPYSRRNFNETVRLPPVSTAQVHVPPFSQSVEQHIAGDTLSDNKE